MLTRNEYTGKHPSARPTTQDRLETSARFHPHPTPEQLTHWLALSCANDAQIFPDGWKQMQMTSPETKHVTPPLKQWLQRDHATTRLLWSYRSCNHCFMSLQQNDQETVDRWRFAVQVQIFPCWQANAKVRLRGWLQLRLESTLIRLGFDSNSIARPPM